MNKKEISEIKKQFSNENCAITRICGCYVDGEKEKKTEMREAFLSLPEEEIFKYFELFKKTLSGTVGKNLLNMEFPLAAEAEDGPHAFLMQLKESRLTDQELLEAFYDKVIASYEFGENYLILLIHAAYDIPGKALDGAEMFDASDEVYEYLLCSICPVKLSEPGLSYNPETNAFQDRIRDWIVSMPRHGFLFPAFHDRSTDIHSLLYYSKNAEEIFPDFVETLLGCSIPLTAGVQKEAFQVLIEETLGEECEYEVVKNIHENLNELIEEQKEAPEPLALDQLQVKSLLAKSGVEPENLETFDRQFEAIAGDAHASLLASNIANTRKFEIKTPDVVIQVNPKRTDLVETRLIDGRKCLVIGIDDQVEINGISVKTFLESTEA